MIPRPTTPPLKMRDGIAEHHEDRSDRRWHIAMRCFYVAITAFGCAFSMGWV